MPHTQRKAFYPKPSSFSDNLFLQVANTLIIIQPESENTVKKADFELKVLHCVRCQI